MLMLREKEKREDEEDGEKLQSAKKRGRLEGRRFDLVRQQHGFLIGMLGRAPWEKGDMFKTCSQVEENIQIGRENDRSTIVPAADDEGR